MALPGGQRVAVTELAPGTTRKLKFGAGPDALEAFLVHHDDGVAAYVNRCPHTGTPLDLWENEFLDADGQRLVCATHGAVFAADSGRCLDGPCTGASLTPLDVVQDGAELIVSPRSARWPS